MRDKSKILKLVGEVRPDVAVARPPAQLPRLAAAVLIFSPVRPHRYVAKMARIIVGAKTAEFGENLLLRDMRVIAQDLLTAGADPVAVREEVRGLEAAIRAEIWRIVLTPGVTDDV